MNKAIIALLLAATLAISFYLTVFIGGWLPAVRELKEACASC